MTVLDFAHDTAKRHGLILVFDDDVVPGEVLIVQPNCVASRPRGVYVHSSAAQMGLGTGAKCWNNHTQRTGDEPV